MVESGEIIECDLDDVPYPTYLILGLLGDKPLHAVVGMDAVNQRCYVIPCMSQTRADGVRISEGD